MHNKKVVKK